MFGSLTHGSSPFVLWNSIIACQRPSFVIHSSKIAIVQLNVNVSLVFRHLYQTWKISLVFISGTWRVYHKIDSTSFITKLAQQKLLKSHWHQSSGTHCNCPLAFCPHSWSSCSRDRRRRRGRSKLDLPHLCWFWNVISPKYVTFAAKVGTYQLTFAFLIRS